MNIQSGLIANRTEANQMAICIEILKTYNCRASEVLKAEWKNFDQDSFLVLIGSKKSSNIIVRDRYILSLISALPKINDQFIFPTISYSKLYHHCKTYYSHLFTKFKKRKYFKVTHGFRYSAVSRFDNETIIRDILHHRSTKSGKFYKIKTGGSDVLSKKS